MNIFISFNFPGMATAEYYCNAVMMTLGKEVNGFSILPDWFLRSRILTVRIQCAPHKYGEIDYHLQIMCWHVSRRLLLVVVLMMVSWDNSRICATFFCQLIMNVYIYFTVHTMSVNILEMIANSSRHSKGSMKLDCNHKIENRLYFDDVDDRSSDASQRYCAQSSRDLLFLLHRFWRYNFVSRDTILSTSCPDFYSYIWVVV